MIIVDIETSGVDFVRCGIWQNGAIELENPKNYFFEEARIDDEDEILNDKRAKKPVLEVIGKTEAQLRDPNKQSQKQLLENFFKWCEKTKIKNFGCQNPFFDVGFIETKARKYSLEIPTHYRTFDLHTLAQTLYFKIHGRLLIEENKSAMNLTKILEFCGIKDERKAHNALEDAKLTAECISRLLYGKNLLREYKQFPVPEYLRRAA